MTDTGGAAELLVYARNGELRAAVEVKAVAGRSEAWARRLLSNLLEFGVVPERVPYFLLVTYDAFYLWGDDRERPLRRYPDGAGSSGAPGPDRRADAARVLAPYLGAGPFPLDELPGEEGLGGLVFSWLCEATYSHPAGREGAPEHGWLSGTGFLETVQGCRPLSGR